MARLLECDDNFEVVESWLTLNHTVGLHIVVSEFWFSTCMNRTRGTGSGDSRELEMSEHIYDTPSSFSFPPPIHRAREDGPLLLGSSQHIRIQSGECS